jgi:hypothetical protein
MISNPSLSVMKDFSMNRGTLSLSTRNASLSISKAIDGFRKFKVAEGKTSAGLTPTNTV